MSITKDQALEKYKQHLKDNVTYMGLGQAILELIENDKRVEIAIGFLAYEVYGLSEENKELREHNEKSKKAVQWLANTIDLYFINESKILPQDNVKAQNILTEFDIDNNERF